MVQPKHRQVNLSELVVVPSLRCRDGEVNSFEPTFVYVARHKITGTPHRHVMTQKHYDLYFSKTQV